MLKFVLINKIMKKYFAIAFLLFVQINASIAQNQTEKIIVSGSLIDSTTKEKLQFASVAVFDYTKLATISSATTNEAGKFSIKLPANGKYKFSIAIIGYTKKVIENVEVKSENIDLGTFVLIPTFQTTEEVKVKVAKSLVTEQVDRTTYNAEADPTNKGADAAEVLRKVPMLSVDLDGNVSMRGSQNVKVLINGKPSTITAGSVADALKQIPADQIKSVEVITSPSSKYDAEGSAGIINIILKKSNLEGYNLNLDASAGYRMSSLGLNGSYRKGKMGFSLGGHGRAVYNVPGSFTNTQTTTENNSTPIVNTQSANTQNQRYFGAYTFGWDYDINKKNSINSSIKYSFKNIYLDQNDLKTVSSSGFSTLANTNSDNLSTTIDANLTYTRTFEKPQREFSILALYSISDGTNNFLSSRLDTALNMKNLNTSANQEITLQVDYSSPIDSNQSFEIGAKNISRLASSDYQYLFANNGGSYTPSANTNLSNSFKYNQNVSAGYVSYLVNFWKTYSLKAGVRYEHTDIDASFGSATTVTIPSYDVLVPSINLSKRLANGNTLKASYTRRIQRPSLQFLNPNFQSTNAKSVTVGNPLLSPEYSNNYELAYSTTIMGASVSFVGFVRNTNNSIQSVRDILLDTIRTTYKNIGSEDAYGFNIFANIRLFKNKLNLNGGTDVFYAVLKNNVDNPLYNASNQGWVAGYRGNASYKLPRDWSVQLFGFLRGRSVQLQGSQSGFGIYSLGFKKDLFNKKASFGFAMDNLFTPSFYMKNELKSPVITQNSTTVLHNMSFKVTFTYNFGSMGGDKQKAKKTINNDDMKKEGDSMDAGGGGGGSQGGNSGQGKGKPAVVPPVTK